MYKALTIGNYFIEKSIYEGIELTPMKLIKLVYVSHGWYIGFTGNPLIIEQTEAWQYGPVIRSLYNKIKKYGRDNIKTMIFPSKRNKVEYKELKNSNLIIFLDKIWEIYKKYDGLELSNLTHQENTPWYKVWVENNKSLKGGSVIPNSYIEEYYKERIGN